MHITDKAVVTALNAIEDATHLAKSRQENAGTSPVDHAVYDGIVKRLNKAKQQINTASHEQTETV